MKKTIYPFVLLLPLIGLQTSCRETETQFLNKDTKTLEKIMECGPLNYSFSFGVGNSQQPEKAITFKVNNPKRVNLSNTDSCRRYTFLIVDYFLDEILFDRDAYSHINVVFTSDEGEQKIEGSYPEVMESMINYYFQNMHLDRALEIAKKLVERSPNDPDYYWIRGRVFYEMKKYREALSDLKKAVQMNPEKTAFQESLGYAYVADSSFTEAVGVFTKLLDKDFQNEEASIELAWLYLQLNLPDEALKRANDISSISEWAGAKYRLQSMAYAKKNQPDSANAIISRLLLTDSSGATLRVAGNVKLMEKKLALACDYFTKAALLGDQEALQLHAKNCN
ncbi:MAG: tetratricopeptide repeat protein [Bacteroidetes bacterium]|jgi:tetratricopeptide (TPR) repeat protein|nr:tetratricopeptide repeat protein [Bacteroidota bacterium]